MGILFAIVVIIGTVLLFDCIDGVKGKAKERRKNNK